MTARVVIHDARHYDELLSPRVELFWHPNVDGSPSTAGRVVFHTQWHHFRDGLKFAESPGPRVEHAFDAILGRTFEVPDGEGGAVDVPTALVMATIKSAFDVLYNEQFTAQPELESEG